MNCCTGGFHLSGVYASCDVKITTPLNYLILDFLYKQKKNGNINQQYHIIVGYSKYIHNIPIITSVLYHYIPTLMEVRKHKMKN